MPIIKEHSQTYTSNIPDGSYLLLVESKRPWYAPDFLIRKGFKNAIAEYQNVKGLIRKCFTIGHNGFFGGLYSWKDRSSLERFYNETRIKAVEKKRGMRPILSIFKVIQSKDFPVGLPPSDNAKKEWDGDYRISIVNRGLAAEHQNMAQAEFDKLNSQSGQITSYLALGDDGNVYDIRLWISQEDKDSKLKGISSKDFNAPVLIEGTNGTD